MRTLILTMLLLALFSTSCKKNPTPATPVTGGTITITSISPAMFYTDDNITITGTGFNVDIAKDTVEFGRMDDKSDDDTTQVFMAYYKSKITDYTIMSASATKLILKPSVPDSLYKTVFTNNYNHSSENIRFRVKSAGSSAISDIVTFKNIPFIATLIDANHPMRPNDSAQVDITGVFSNSICDVNLYISGNKALGCTYADQYLNSNLYYVPGPCTCEDFGTLVYGCPQGVNSLSKGRLVSYNAGNQIATIRFLMPGNFFGTSVGGGYGPVINLKVQAVNKDGRSGPVRTLATELFPTH